MTWTYSSSLATDKDRVRFLIGDTDTNDQLIQDEEITWLLAEHPSVRSAAAEACEAIARKFARQVDVSVDDVRVSASQRAERYQNLAAALRAQDARTGKAIPLPSAPGLSQATKGDREADEDLVQPFFRRNLFTVNRSDEDDA